MQKILQIVTKGLFAGQKWGFLLRLADHRAGFWQTTPPNKQAWFRVTLADALD
jgi:hypothetical protein